MESQIKENKKGFTLIEILVVLLIVGLLAGIVGPKLFGHADKAKYDNAKIQMENLSAAIKLFKLDTGRYPTTEQGLQALVAAPEGVRNYKKGGYLAKKSVPKDPWGNPYIYLSPGVNDDFDLTSYGEDGAPGGAELAKDINSWEAE